MECRRDTATKKRNAATRLKFNKGVDVIELQGVLDKLELAFTVLPYTKSKAAQYEASVESSNQGKGAPILEEALGEALDKLVKARELVAGKPRRRKRKKQ